MQFKGTNGVISNKDNWINDIITNIAIVDGGDVLMSASLKELQAIQSYRHGHTPYILIDERGGQDQRDEVTIEFGRYLWDPEYYLDLKRFNNPQLKITTKGDAIRDMGDTGYVSGSIKVSLVCHIMEEGAKESKGFYADKEIYDFMSASSGDEHVVMPIDYPYVGMMLHSPDREIGIEDLISKIKISCDSEKFVPMDRYTDDLQRAVKRQLGILTIPSVLHRKTDERVYTPLYRDITAEMIPMAAGIMAAVTDRGPGYLTLGLHNTDHSHHAMQVKGSETANDTSDFVHLFDGAGNPPVAETLIGNAGGGSDYYIDTSQVSALTAIDSEMDLLVRVAGRSLHNTLYVPFGVPREPETLFASSDWHSIKLALTQAGVGNVAVCLVQLRELAAAK